MIALASNCFPPDPNPRLLAVRRKSEEDRQVSTGKISRPGPGTQAATFARGQDYLRKVDPVIGQLIERRPDFDPHAWLDELPPMDLFGSLLFQVTGQQLSVAATRRTVGRVTSLFGGQMPSPDQLLAVDPNDLRAAGLSWRKVNTLRDLAGRFVDGRLDIERLRGMSDDEFIAELTAVPGIGPDLDGNVAGTFGRRNLDGAKVLPQARRSHRGQTDRDQIRKPGERPGHTLLFWQ